MENWFLTRQITPKDFVSFSITHRCGHHSASQTQCIVTRSYRLLSCHGPSLSLVSSPIVSILVIQLSNCRPRPLLRLGYKGLFSRKIVLGPEFLFSDSRKPLSFISRYREKQYILNLLYLDFCFVQSYFQTSGQTVEALLSNIPVKLNLLTAKNRDSHV